MERRSVNSFLVPTLLLFFSAIPILMGLVRSVQVPLGTLPDDAIKFAATPFGLWAHALAGAIFGILGPLQFGRVLARRFGTLHRRFGIAFVAAGAILALSGLRLVLAFPGTSTSVLDLARILASAGLAFALWWAIGAARRRRFDVHAAWMIRAYALGMGASTIALIMFPIYIITGEAPMGLASDLLFLGSWTINLTVAEWIIRKRLQPEVVAS